MKSPLPSVAFLCLIIISLSCSKSSSSSSNEKDIEITVVEYKSNIPIASAIVEYYKPCASCSRWLGGYDRVFVTATSAGGFAEIPESIFNDPNYSITITPNSLTENYWGFSSIPDHTTQKKYELDLIADCNLHLVKTNSFPGAYYIDILAKNERYTMGNILARVYGFPSDTTVAVQPFGGQKNYITWKFYDAADSVISTGGPLEVEVLRKGSPAIELQY